MRSRVVPGMSSTIAWRCPTRRLNSVDLPTFGRPTMATTGFTSPSPNLSHRGGRGTVHAAVALRQEAGDAAHDVARGLAEGAAGADAEGFANANRDGPARFRVEHSLGAGDAHRQDWRAAAAGQERCAVEGGQQAFTMAAVAFGEHADHAAFAQNALGPAQGLPIHLVAPDRESAIGGGEDEAKGELEGLLLGHETHVARQDATKERRVGKVKMVAGHNQWPLARHALLALEAEVSQRPQERGDNRPASLIERVHSERATCASTKSATAAFSAGSPPALSTRTSAMAIQSAMLWPCSGSFSPISAAKTWRASSSSSSTSPARARARIRAMMASTGASIDTSTKSSPSDSRRSRTSPGLRMASMMVTGYCTPWRRAKAMRSSTLRDSTPLPCFSRSSWPMLRSTSRSTGRPRKRTSARSSSDRL